ncbi:RidA family protein [Roseobacter sp. HKCCD9010]|nr:MULTISPECIES: RidA family protein [unclassified Roseobacter]MBF9052165.1 RidA family protein [Rhodobacterales bacterium HKCCD4356]NNW34243.1 RidA family protein [Roseobacter sp. HKCCD8198]NNW55574.1 RidA family protein [Roseobacter sp. HKCCD8284]NNX87663.1 RidA family protein [Roseobacter sp. HKCCD8809]NNY42996.1 RidA family protein [Roseobacter sp. HKCCD8831]NNY64332.1 RidA family protein [Roseobacter sp. HKCCD8499]NOC30439.1 RidA family protein [Roseobacter sp. HKCCD9057]NPU73822.1 Rid
MTIRCNPPTRWPQLGRPFHHGMVEPKGRVLHMTGQVVWDHDGNVIGKDDCETQARQCFDNVESILKAVGGRLDDIVSLTVFYLDPADMPAIQKVRAERLQLTHGPFSILIQVAGLITPDLLVEVAPIAAIPDDRFHEPRY